MRRILLLVAVLGLLAPMGARGAGSCGVTTCLSSTTAAELDCSADGRGDGGCTGRLTYELTMTSPSPFESTDYTGEVTCSVACAGATSIDTTCGWAPPEIRPVGETGCEVSDLIEVSFTPSMPAGSCATFMVEITLAARARIDPLPTTDSGAATTQQICA